MARPILVYELSTSMRRQKFGIFSLFTLDNFFNTLLIIVRSTTRPGCIYVYKSCNYYLT